MQSGVSSDDPICIDSDDDQLDNEVQEVFRPTEECEPKEVAVDYGGVSNEVREVSPPSEKCEPREAAVDCCGAQNEVQEVSSPPEECEPEEVVLDCCNSEDSLCFELDARKVQVPQRHDLTMHPQPWADAGLESFNFLRYAHVFIVRIPSLLSNRQSVVFHVRVRLHGSSGTFVGTTCPTTRRRMQRNLRKKFTLRDGS